MFEEINIHCEPHQKGSRAKCLRPLDYIDINSLRLHSRYNDVLNNILIIISPFKLLHI